MRKFFHFYFYLFTCVCIAQKTMEPGFKMLEGGDFDKAEIFFKAVLDSEPQNKTAQICYGRAVGLNGAPGKATELFKVLAKEYPNDFEVLVNYYESFLWGNDYEAAKPLYEKLVEEYPNEFGAILGYANTLSNLREYEAALEWIKKAIAIQPNNESAKVSKKFMILGYANEFINKQQYDKGIGLMQEVFIDFPEDKDALLNLANAYLIIKKTDSAETTFWRYATSPVDSISAMNGIVLAYHIAENNKKALNMALQAKNRLRVSHEAQLKNKTYERYVQALIWNRKFKSAQQQIDSLQNKHGNDNWILALKATLGMYTGNFKTSLESYSSILKNDSTSFDGNLGKANALFASDLVMPAYRAAFQTLTIFKEQKDALGFIEKLNGLHRPIVAFHSAYTFDNGNNVAYANTFSGLIPFSDKFRTSISYQYRSAINTITLNEAQSHIAILGLDYKLFPNTNLNTSIGLNNSRFSGTAYTQPVLNAQLRLKPYKLQNLELGYQREVQNFNADLIEREIVMNHYGLNYNLGTNVNLGWYTQLMHTVQTDDNTRNLLFTSLYYTVMQKPSLKLGLNYQYISFGEQVPLIYFSPKQYQAGEVFVDIRGALSEKTGYMASAATGLQKVEADPQTNIFRAEAGLQHQIGRRTSADLYGKYSNIASATAAGFEFTEIGLRIKWALTKKPIFYGKVEKLGH